ncbi:MAG: glycosyltransferase family 39 protein [Verrucomicrobiales bacterium]
MKVFSWLIIAILFGVWLGLLFYFDEVPRALRWPARFVLVSAGALAIGCTLFRLRQNLLPLGRLFCKANGRPDFLIIALLLSIQGIVVYNAVTHNAVINFDYRPHADNIEVWSQGRIPVADDTRGFHYAPLMYLLPAWIHASGATLREALKAAQILNSVYCLILLLYLLALCQLLRPGDALLRRMALLTLGCLPVFYKSFAFARPEPMLSMLALASLYYGLRLLVGQKLRKSDVILFGLTVGLAMLARQWAAFFFPAFGLLLLWQLWQRYQKPQTLVLGLVVAALISVSIGSWYYIHLTLRYGTPAAFNSELQAFSFSNKPASFYWDWKPEQLFGFPVTPTLTNRLGPMLFTETWGDYLGYWRLYPLRLNHPGAAPHNWDEAGAHQGQVNLAAVYPSVLLLIAFLAGLWCCRKLIRRQAWPGFELPGRVLLSLAVLGTCLGYFVFVVSYVNSSAIRATYILQIFPPLAILMGFWWTSILRQRTRLGALLLGAWLACMIPIVPMFFSNHINLSGLRVLMPLERPLIGSTLLLGIILWVIILRMNRSEPASASSPSAIRHDPAPA